MRKSTSRADLLNLLTCFSYSESTRASSSTPKLRAAGESSRAKNPGHVTRQRAGAGRDVEEGEGAAGARGEVDRGEGSGIVSGEGEGGVEGAVTWAEEAMAGVEGVMIGPEEGMTEAVVVMTEAAAEMTEDVAEGVAGRDSQNGELRGLRRKTFIPPGRLRRQRRTPSSSSRARRRSLAKRATRKTWSAGRRTLLAVRDRKPRKTSRTKTFIRPGRPSRIRRQKFYPSKAKRRSLRIKRRSLKIWKLFTIEKYTLMRP